ncbi:two-component sensor histidine kinase [Thalassomonas viridans]|uniref:histidine kinase n=1 Tax=Thalassomonas viridans TaxID=137584 RepID=A0AAE9YYW7_9GAMM|nr:ATP-binding protein [Thalassomonas viridans]WDE03483.1 two-component sensor histidine kinase [Thalassomonas viridans]
MFVRIYSGIFLAILVSIAGVYTTYQLNLQSRLSSYSQSVLQGSLMLISEGYNRQQEKNKERWLSLVGKMTGLNPSISALNKVAEDPWQLTMAAEGKLNITMSHQNQKISIALDHIGEQQLRAIALLILNELARVKEGSQEQQLQKLQKLFTFPVTFVDKHELNLDSQQQIRLNKGEVVVSSLSQDAGYSVYVKAKQGKILHVGVINKFEPITTELLVFLISICLIITSMVVYFLVYRLEYRLNVVNRIVGEFGPKKIKNRVPIKGNDVITQLGIKVNEMANRIEQLLQHQKEITQAVSHELRTPIARIRFRLQILSDACDELEQAENNEEMKSQLDEKVIGISRDIDQLEALIDEMLCLYKLDIDPADYKRSLVNIDELLTSVLDLAKLPYSHIEFQLKKQAGITGYCHADDVDRLLQNLISNAGKHANSRVDVTLEQTEQGFCISVADDGAGIPQADRERIFEPFTRLDSSRNKKVKGYGLGLAIVSRIASLNQAKVWVETSPLGGANFKFHCFCAEHIAANKPTASSLNASPQQSISDNGVKDVAKNALADGSMEKPE